LRNLTLSQSARRPVVFVLEDLHWIDLASQDCFRYLAEQCTRSGSGFFDSHLWRWNIRVPLATARIALLEGDLAQADRHLTASLQLAEKTESQKYVAEARGLRAELLQAAGRPDEARADLRAAVAVAEAIGYARGIWQLGAALGRALARSGQEAEARLAYGRALAALNRSVPRIPAVHLAEALLRSEAVARLREEAGVLGVTG
jgi:tetratricopeptide (TPR) repeat protein